MRASETQETHERNEKQDARLVRFELASDWTRWKKVSDDFADNLHYNNKCEAGE